jgi:uncharacterized protein (DUF1697 family)
MQSSSDKMKVYAVLLRGVMPMGKNKVPMAQLREVLTNAGFQNVRTYIQSGNAIVTTHLSAKELEKRVHGLIKTHIGPDLAVVVRTGAQLKKMLDGNPFKQDFDISRVFFVSFSNPPDEQAAKDLAAMDYGDEKLVITPMAGYMYIPGSAARSKLSNVSLEKKLGVSATTRNFNTISKLIEMSRDGLNLSQLEK